MFRKVIGQKTDESPAAPASSPAPKSPAPAAAASAPASSPASPASPASPQQAARPQSPPSVSRNVLSSDVDIKGTVKFTNDLVVDGKIEGEISSEGNLTVGENARLKAEIKTATVVVYGKVHGNITASDRVELKASAEVVGDIRAKTLSIEAGAIIVGKSTVGTPSTPVQGNKPAPQQGSGNKQQSNKPQQQGKQGNGGGNKPQQGNLTGIKN